MCEIIERNRNEAKMEEKRENVIGLLKEGFNIDGIARALKLSVEQVTAIGKQAALL